VLDTYDRSQRNGEMAVLEVSNGRLTAVVAPHLGGRLLSLRNEAADRELLFANPVFQPANLGSLNAWFSGGVEWNGLIPGHSPMSCTAVFAGVVNTERGPVLRLYEFDRVVEATWQIDLYIPADDDRLFVHGRIVNADAMDKEAYWWTNIAVPTTTGMRVLSPADYAIEHVLPGNQLEHFAFPDRARFDGSYPGLWSDATSVFFRTETPQRLWMAALDAHGAGLAHVASDQMQGRKFFYFGTGVGGQQWMDFLSQPGKGDYVEIQSGIAPTQNQRFALPAHSEVHWTEVYAGVQVDPQLAQHKDYQAATQAVGQVIQTRFDAEDFADVDLFLRTVSSQPVTERLHAGSAWGMRQEQLTGQPLAQGLDFEMRSALPAQDAWDELLKNGMFSAASLEDVPHTWAIAARWCAALEHSADWHGTTWLHALALGMAAHNRGEMQQARACYEQSLAMKPTWLAYRQSALIASNEDARETAYMLAWRQPGAPEALAVEIMRMLVDSGRLDAARAFIDALPASARAQERIHLSAAQLAAHSHDWALLEELLEHPFATVREGETLLDSLWTTLQQGLCQAHWTGQWTEARWLTWQAEHPVPTRLNFRMQAAVASPVATSSSGVLPHGQR
jgi:hypothetical protein